MAGFLSKSLVSTLYTLLPLALLAHGDDQRPVRHMFNFGDSYSSNGFTPSGTAPSRANPIGNPAWPGHTWAQSRNYISLLCEPGSNPFDLLTFDLAKAGATVAPMPNPPGSNVSTPHFAQQIARFALFAQGAGRTVEWGEDDTLFTFWFGVNDVGKLSLRNENWDTLGELLDAAVGVYVKLLDVVYGMGARRMLVFLCPPIHLTPLFLNANPALQSRAKFAVAAFNDKLLSALAAYRLANNHRRPPWMYNATQSFLTIVNDPERFGAVNSRCSGKGSECVWASSFHPGDAVHRLIAEDLRKRQRFFYEA